MHPKDADGMANSIDPNQTASSEAVWSWSALFAETYLSQYIEFVRYIRSIDIKISSFQIMPLKDLWNNIFGHDVNCFKNNEGFLVMISTIAFLVSCDILRISVDL